MPVWQKAAGKHRIPIPYLRVMPGISCALRSALLLELPWHILRGQHAVCRLRCGLVALGHRQGRRSCAKTQNCIFCEAPLSHVWAHVFGACPISSEHRTAALSALNAPAELRAWDIMYAIVSAVPSRQAYKECVSFIAEVVIHAEQFWKQREV